MELQLVLVTQAAEVRIKTHQLTPRLLEQVAQDLLAVTVPSTVAVAAAALVVLVFDVEMELHQLQQHLQAVLA
jgi:hypothetical protein